MLETLTFSAWVAHFSIIVKNDADVNEPVEMNQ
jgi:hypothetical protein